MQALVGGFKKDRFRKPPVCWNCNEVRHIQRYCPKEKTTPNSQHKAKEATCTPLSMEEKENAFSACNNLSKDNWIVDSGATSHMTFQKELLTDFHEFHTPEKVGLGDGKIVEAIGVGNVHLIMQFKVSDQKQAVMYKVLYVPNLACNLFSVRAAAERGNTVKFGHSKCWIRKRTGELVGMASLTGKLYHLHCKLVSPIPEQASAVCELEVDLWHQRLGHLNAQHLKDIAQKELATGIKLPKETTLSLCEGCVEGKMHRKPFKSVGGNRSTRKLQLVHSDVCGPMQTESLGGKRYFVTFIDDFSRCCAVHFLKNKYLKNSRSLKPK